MNRQQYRQAILTAALALSAISVGVDNALAGRSPPSQGATNDSIENFTYGPCMGPALYQQVDGTGDSYASCYHNWGLTFGNSVLIYSRTAAERNASLGTPLPSGSNVTPGATNVAQAGLKRILLAAGITSVNVTESVGSLPGQGSTTGAVIFLDTSGDVLWDHGRSVNPSFAVPTTTSGYVSAGSVGLRQYMRQGGGFVAIHNAVGTERNWDWYVGLLGGASTYDSAVPQGQSGIVQIQSADSSTNAIGPPGTEFTLGNTTGGDSFFTLIPYPTNVKYLATVLASSLATPKAVHPGHGLFWPVAWCQYYDGGRSWVTTLGEDPRLWADLTQAINQPGGANYFPGAAQFQQMVVQGVLSAMGKVPFCT